MNFELNMQHSYCSLVFVSVLANGSGPSKCYHSTLYVCQMNLFGMCQIWAYLGKTLFQSVVMFL